MTNLLPPTPADPESIQAPEEARIEFLKFASKNGLVAISYPQEKQGLVFPNIVPVKGAQNEMSNRGTDELFPHTDAPHRNDSPHFTGLICLRQEPGALTFWTDVSEIVNRLDTNTIDLLQKPEFLHKPSTSWINDVTAIKPILYKLPDGDWAMHVNLGFCRGATERAVRAIGTLIRMSYQCMTESIEMQPGELLIIDNRRALHGRKKFLSNYDGSARWLVRCYFREI